MGNLGNIVDEMRHNRKVSTRLRQQIQIAKDIDKNERPKTAPTSTTEIMMGHFSDLAVEVQQMENQLEQYEAMKKDRTLFLSWALSEALKPKDFEEYLTTKEWKPYILTFEHRMTDFDTSYVSDLVLVKSTWRHALRLLWQTLRGR